MRLGAYALLCVLLGLWAETSLVSASEMKPRFDAAGRFWVYNDGCCNGWLPAGWMPEQASQMITEFDLGWPDKPQSGKKCIHVRINNWQSPYWCGVNWAKQDPKKPDGVYWGKVPLPGWDLTGARRVVFWARASRLCRLQFKACILGREPHGDSSRNPIHTHYLTITSKWTEYVINLKGADLSRVVSGFCFVTSRDAQVVYDEPVEFFLDTIYWDFSREPSAASSAAHPASVSLETRDPGSARQLGHP